MKTSLAYAISVILLVSLFTGCGTTPKKAAYATLASVGAAVDNSMKAAAAGKKAGKITDAQWAQIAAIHDNKFLPAYNTAVDIAAMDYTKLAPDNVQQIATELITLINQLTK